VTARLLLFATAWAATSTPNLPPAVPEDAPGEAPEPAVVPVAMPPADGLKARQAMTAVVMGAIGALGLSRLIRRDKEG
jgi:membrane protein